MTQVAQFLILDTHVVAKINIAQKTSGKTVFLVW